MKDDLNQMIPEHERREIERIFRATKQESCVAAPWLCRMGFHRWSKWWTKRAGKYTDTGWAFVDQRRVCCSCGLVQLKERR